MTWCSMNARLIWDAMIDVLWCAMIDEWLGFGMIDVMLYALMYAIVCVSMDIILNMSLIGLRHNKRKPTLGLGSFGCLTPSQNRT